jgi:hypothetical protein
MASISSVVKSGTFSTSKNSCIRDTFDVVLQLGQPNKNYGRGEHAHVITTAFLARIHFVNTCRDRVTTSLFKSLTNGGKNGIERTILDAYDWGQATVGLDNNAMLLTEFSDRLCSFPNIWMEFDLVQRI